ncbi:hypothetical protein [Myroides odoratimimus]|uniref:hypothetical protein n=1 Tax=Myroides odoratimimus TaxID=76832 RepID=UPI0029BFC257|nr:hypothetical protein [Myroides odoratimimus]MDX4975378.1 hypothetical protein [Myroides odoratimimus]
MNKIKGLIVRKKDVLLYFICLVAIFVSDDTITFGTNSNTLFIALKYIIYFIVLLCVFFYKPLGFLKKDRLLRQVYFTFVTLILATVFFGGFSGGYLYQILLLTISFLVISKFDIDLLLYYFLKIVYFIAFVSIIGSVVYIILPPVIQLLPKTINLGMVHFYNGGIFAAIGYVEVYRNSGIFREPGVFMVYLNLALAIQLLYFKVYDRRYIIVLSLALFLTLSTAGFLIYVLVLMCVYFENAKKIRFINKLIVVGFALICFVTIFSNSFIYENVFSKLSSDTLKEGSALARQASIFGNARIFADNMWFGVGLRDFEKAFEITTYSLFGVKLSIGNNTNTLGSIFAIYGVFMGLLIVYLLSNLIRFFSKKMTVRFLFTLAILSMLSNEDLRLSLIFYLLLLLPLKKDNSLNVIIRR